MGLIKREELEKIIAEELSQLDEGFLSRLMAKAKGNMSGLQAIGKNASSAFKMITQGDKEAVLQNPKVAKLTSMAASRILAYEKKLSKLTIEFTSDMKMMFGESFENMPDDIKQKMNVWGEDVKEMLSLTHYIAQSVSKEISSAEQSADDEQNTDLTSPKIPTIASLSRQHQRQSQKKPLRQAKPRYGGEQGRPFGENISERQVGMSLQPGDVYTLTNALNANGKKLPPGLKIQYMKPYDKKEGFGIFMGRSSANGERENFVLSFDDVNNAVGDDSSSYIKHQPEWSHPSQKR